MFNQDSSHQLPNFNNSFDPSGSSSLKLEKINECYSYPIANNNNSINSPTSTSSSSNNNSSNNNNIGPSIPDYQTLQDAWPSSFYPYQQTSSYNNCEYNSQIHETIHQRNPTNPYSESSNHLNLSDSNNNNNNNNTVLWNHMRSLSSSFEQPILNNSLNSPSSINYSKLALNDYNNFVQFPYPSEKSEASLNPTRGYECVRCGIPVGHIWQQDNAGNYLCQACASPISNHSMSIDMLNKRTNSTNNSSNINNNPNSNNQKNNLSRKQTAKRTGQCCFNCKTDNTTLWRRNSEGQQVCNACGLYYKLHTKNRPTSMRKEVLQTRKRKTKRKPNVNIKFMGSEYSLKPEILNNLDHQLMNTVTNTNGPCLLSNNNNDQSTFNPSVLSNPTINASASYSVPSANPISSYSHSTLPYFPNSHNQYSNNLHHHVPTQPMSFIN